MKFILTNYCHDPRPVLKYTDDFFIMDRSDDGKDWCEGLAVERTENKGHCDYDKLTFLVQNYDNLPEIFLWGKTNIFPRHMTEEQFRETIKGKEFAPLLAPDHRTYSDKFGQVNYYQDGMYYERNDGWYLGTWPAFNIRSWDEWADAFQLPKPSYIPFAPGGNYILTRERVQRYSRDYYDKMRNVLPYSVNPGEAHMAERSYYLLWR